MTAAPEVSESVAVDAPQAVSVNHEAAVKLQQSSGLVATPSKSGKRLASSKKPLKPKVGAVKKRPLPKAAVKRKAVAKDNATPLPPSKAKPKAALPKKKPKARKP